MPEVGRLAVCLALLFAADGVLAGVAGGLRRRAHLVRSAEHAAYAVFGLVVIATAILLRALLRHDFTLEYVAAYSSSTLPTQYTIAALWGGQKGSLLFWSLLLPLFTTVVQVQNRERNRVLMPFVTATLMTVAVFFLSLLVFVTDPFERLPVAAREGADLNPLLQNYWMMIHPPSLYTGYVSASGPFASASAALATGQLGDQWTRSVRRWALFSWAFLSLGNLLGARWAYEVLGWGGYWAWDPVENAAFMPWLVSTAYLHSVMIQEKRDMLRVWHVVLVLLTFALTIFGPFLPPSGALLQPRQRAARPGPPLPGRRGAGDRVAARLAAEPAARLRGAGGGGTRGGCGARRGARPARLRLRDLRARRLRARHRRAGVLARHARAPGDAPRERAARARAADREEPAALRRLPDPRRRGLDLRRHGRLGRLPQRGAGGPQAGRRDGGGQVPAPLRAHHERRERAPLATRGRGVGVARREADRDPGAREALLQDARAADDRGGDALDARRGPLPRARFLRSALGAGEASGLRQPARLLALDRRLHHGRRHAGHEVAVGRRAAGGGARAGPGAGAGAERRP